MYIPVQIADSVCEYSSVKKLGSHYGAKNSTSITQAEAQAKKQARQRDEQNFARQAGIQLSPSHMY